VRGADEPKDPARLPAVEEPKDAQDAGPQTPGAVLLRELELDEPVSEQVVCTWYRRVDELLETWSAEELTRYLVREAGSGKPRSRMAVLAALVKNLRPKTVKTNLTPSLPPLCSKCEEWEPAAARNPKLRLRRDRWGRPVLGDDGLAQRCAECHPDSGELPHAQTA
jgi:hypothetical protein